MRRLQLHYCITTNNLFFFLIFFLFNIFIWCRCVQSFVVFTFDSFSISMFFMLSRFFYLSFFVFTFALSFYISFQFLILLLVQNADLNPGFCVSKWMWLWINHWWQWIWVELTTFTINPERLEIRFLFIPFFLLVASFMSFQFEFFKSVWLRSFCCSSAFCKSKWPCEIMPLMGNVRHKRYTNFFAFQLLVFFSLSFDPVSL